MKIITLNVNGIRSAASKGFFEWLPGQAADVICLQETRAESAKLDPAITAPDGYRAYFNDAERKGYSGVAIYSRQPPDRIRATLGWESADREGRYIQADFGALSVISIYLPSGSSGPERQAIKYAFMNHLLPVLQRFRRQKRNYILCGDWNIAHRNIDIKNWRGNQKNSGFLPEERAWLDKVFDEVGLVDAFRVVNPDADQYTWWSNRGQAWAKNVGWRIDYQITSPRLRDRVRGAEIYKAQRFSDHAPLIMEYDLKNL